MIPLKANSILQRTPNVKLQLNASNQIDIQTDGRTVSCAQHGLAVLDAFSQPTPLRVAINRLKARGEQHWIDLTEVILQLYEAGVLQNPEVRNHGNFLKPTGFGGTRIHVAMLNDRARTASFLAAIREVVRPGDIVLDIGTGTGVLAVAAARAGAAHVYAVEAGAMADVASALFAREGLTDRITLLREWSTEIKLPEPADVLVREIIGNDPLDERILEMTRDARKRLLKPDARLIPHTLTIYGLPLSLPQSELNKSVPTEETLQRWKSWYDIDFTPLAEATDRSSFSKFVVNSHSTVEWPVFSDPVVLAETKFALTEPLVIDRKVEVTATAAGQLNGFMVYFEAGLGPTAALSTSPSQASEENSWRHPVWHFGEGLTLQTGDRFGLHFQSGKNGRFSQVRLLRPGQK
jgi:protein arginine N-methyltransferase 1